MLGSSEHLSPEQTEQEDRFKCDIFYTLGCDLLFHILNTFRNAMILGMHED